MIGIGLRGIPYSNDSNDYGGHIGIPGAIN